MREFLAKASGKGWKRAGFLGTLVTIAMVIGFETHAVIFVPVALAGLAAAWLINAREQRRATAAD